MSEVSGEPYEFLPWEYVANVRLLSCEATLRGVAVTFELDGRTRKAIVAKVRPAEPLADNGLLCLLAAPDGTLSMRPAEVSQV